MITLKYVLIILMIIPELVSAGGHLTEVLYSQQHQPDNFIVRVFKCPTQSKSTEPNECLNWGHEFGQDFELDMWCGKSENQWLEIQNHEMKHPDGNYAVRPRYVSASIVHSLSDTTKISKQRTSFFYSFPKTYCAMMYDLDQTTIVAGNDRDMYSITNYHARKTFQMDNVAVRINNYEKNHDLYKQKVDKYHRYFDWRNGEHTAEFCESFPEARKCKTNLTKLRSIKELKDYIMGYHHPWWNEVIVSPLPQNVVGFFSRDPERACQMLTDFGVQFPIIAKKNNVNAWLFHTEDGMLTFNFIKLKCPLRT